MKQLRLPSIRLVRPLLSLLLALLLPLHAWAIPLSEDTESSPLPSPSLSAACAALTDGDGQLLWGKDAHRAVGMASTTKIMTALVVAETCDPRARVTIPKEATGIEGSSIYLCEGEVLTVEQLLFALLLASANDAATALAIFASGSTEAFCDRMNERAQGMGLTQTHFENPHGLSHENHYTTAYELAQITAQALKNPLVEKIVSTYKTSIPLCGEENGRVLVNHNKMLRLYDGAIGVKTGFTKKTGRTLVSAARRDGLCLIAVTLDAPDDWNDHQKLLDYGFSRYTRVTLWETGEVIGTLPLCGGTESYVSLKAEYALSLTLPKGTASPAWQVEAYGHFLYAPVKADTTVARAVCQYGDTRYEIPLRAATDHAYYRPKAQTPLDRLLHFFH